MNPVKTMYGAGRKKYSVGSWSLDADISQIEPMCCQWLWLAALSLRLAKPEIPYWYEAACGISRAAPRLPVSFPVEGGDPSDFAT